MNSFSIIAAGMNILLKRVLNNGQWYSFPWALVPRRVIVILFRDCDAPQGACEARNDPRPASPNNQLRTLMSQKKGIIAFDCEKKRASLRLALHKSGDVVVYLTSNIRLLNDLPLCDNRYV